MRLTRTASAVGDRAWRRSRGRRGAAADPLPTSAEHVPRRAAAWRPTTRPTPSSSIRPTSPGCPRASFAGRGCNCPDDAIKVGCGMDWEGATPLPFGLATGLRVDLVEPPWGGPDSEGIGFPYRGSNYAWITWALAAKLGHGASFGMSLDHSYSQNPYVDDLWGVTAALSYRPNPHFGFSAVARDFNEPSPTLLPSISHVAPAQPVLDGRYTLAMAFRPTGRRSVDLGFEIQYCQGSKFWVPRGTLGVDVPCVGRAYASVEIAHLLNDSERGVLGTAGLELHFGGLSAGGGALFGNGFGGDRRRVRDGVHRRLHAARHSVPRARRVDPAREHAGHARTRRAAPQALAPRRSARRRRRHAGPAERAGELVRPRRGDRRRDPRAARARQEGPLLVGGRGSEGPLRLRERRPHRRQPRRRRALRGAQVRVHLPQGSARQDRREGGVRARRPAQERARAVHQRARRTGRGQPTTTTCCAIRKPCSCATCRSTAT